MRESVCGCVGGFECACVFMCVCVCVNVCVCTLVHARCTHVYVSQRGARVQSVRERECVCGWM